jgi:hypothetical protein
MLVETWLDRENFMSEQMKRPYRELYEARLPELLRTPRELSFYEPIPACRKQVGSPDTGAGARRRSLKEMRESTQTISPWD